MPDSAQARWILVASVLGSGAAFLETSVVSVAMPQIGRGLGLGVVGLEAVTNGYLLTLGALILLGGALGDRFGRPTVFALGLAGFALACAGCALAPNATVLVGCRVVQGVGGALLVPNSLAMLETAFTGDARGAAIGQWSAWSAVSTAAGPLVGGWIADEGSWRWVFAIMIPPALAAAMLVLRHAAAAGGPSPSVADRSRRIDYGGAALITVALAATIGSLALATKRGFGSALVWALAAAGVALLVAFVFVEKGRADALLPPGVFRSRVFAVANLVTLLVYAALGGLFFLLMLELQDVMRYSALAAGASLLPVNGLMLLVSPAAGRFGMRHGPRLPLTFGSFVAAIGMALFTRLHPGAGFLAVVLPAIIVFGVGLSVLVAPLTAAVLSALGDRLAGLASGVNNAVARLAGLIATAALPLAAGLGSSDLAHPHLFTVGFARAMWINAAVCGIAAAVAWLGLPRGRRMRRPYQPIS